MTSSDSRAGLTFLHEGGEMGARLRQDGAATTQLGAPQDWPQGLRTAVRLMLHSRQPVCVFWGADAIFLCNDAYAQSIGSTHRPDVAGLPGRDACGAHWHDIAPCVDEVMQGRNPHSQENHWIPVDRNGTRDDAWWTFSAAPIDDEHAPGGIGGALLQYTDTTELVTTVRRLAEIKQRLEAQAGGSGIGTWDWDIATDRIVADEGLAIFYGVDPAKAARGAPIGEFFQGIHPEDLPRVQASIYAAMQSGEPFAQEYRLRHADGRESWVLAEGQCIQDADGKPLRFAGASIDITRRMAVEERLRQLNAALERKVIERAQARGRTWELNPELLGALNSQGYFETSNPAWQTILGWSAQEVASMSIFELMHPDDVERSRAGFERTLQRQSVTQFPNRYRCKDGSYRWISWVGIPEDGLVYCSGRDITREKELADMVQAQDTRGLRQTQELEAVEQLTGGLARDFNGLLAGIGSNLELIAARVGRGEIEHIDRHVAAAQDGVRSAAALTKRLVAVSRRKPLDTRPVYIDRLVDGMADSIRHVVGPDVELKLAAEAGLWPTQIDPGRGESVLLSLCINARDAMHGGGRLTIEAANHWLDEAAAAPRGLTPGAYVRVRVIDTGIGMAPEVLARAFEPFFTTKPPGQGAGLGLSMSHGLVRQAGGKMHIESAPDEGTTVCLHLPRHGGDANAGPGAAARTVEGRVVLVIDDEPSVRMVMAEILEHSGYRVIEADSGPAGLKVLESDAAVDLLISDIGLPGGMNGRQVAQAARAIRPGLKVLFISGYAQNSVMGDGPLERGMAFMMKPFDVQALERKVRDLLAQ